MAQEFARLQLLQDVVAKNGASSHEVIVYRPTCRAMTQVLDSPDLRGQIETFVKHACRVVNGGDTPLEFDPSELDLSDSVEIGQIIVAMSDEADEVTVDETGDGISAPIIYTLRHPLQMSKDGETLHQISFEAKRIKEVTDYLDSARGGETKEFHAFMRAFGKPLGLSVPVMSNTLIDSLDFIDYVVIRRKIMGKFTSARKRWKRSASPAA